MLNSYETQKYLFSIINRVMFVLMVISYIGIWNLAPNYLEILRMVIQIYVSLFLIIRFNPYVLRPNFSELDRTVAFNAGIFVFANTIIAKYVSTIIGPDSTSIATAAI